MPHDLTDVDTFSAPISVPVDSDVRNAASVEAPFQQFANRTRNLQNKVRTDLTDRGCYIGAHRAQSGWDGTLGSPMFVPLNPGAGKAAMVCLDSQRGYLVWDLYPGDDLPFSCKVTTLRAYVEPVADGGAGNRMLLECYRLDDGLATTLVDDAEVGPGTGNKTITISGLDEDLIATNTTLIVPSGEPLGLRVICYAGDVASINDRVMFLEVRYQLKVL